MRLFFLTISLLAFSIKSSSQINTFDWSYAGYQHITLPKDSINFEDFFNSDDSPAELISELIDSYGQANRQLNIYFPNKTYEFNSGVFLESNVHLIGEQTTFRFDLEGQAEDCISVKGSILEDTLFITEPAFENSNMLICPSQNFDEGDLIYLYDDDSELITSSWALGKIGQVLSVSATNADSIFTQEKLRRNYETGAFRYVNQIEAVKNVSVSGIRVVRLDATNAQTNNISFEYAENCLVSCLESYNSNFAHVKVEFSKNIQIQNSYFKDGHDYGSGGKAYGTVLQFGSSDCLIQNNIFEHLRHSILLQAGSNGNVIAYNYSRDPFWTGTNLPANAAGEIVLHGNYPYANLFEGNYAKNIVADNSHGINGPDNTYFRNKVDNGFFFFQSVIDPILANNVIPSNSLFIDFAGIQLTFPNWVNDQIQPSGAEPIDLSSLFLDDVPEYFQNTSFPAIGPEYLDYAFPNPAFSRFQVNNLTPCFGTTSTKDEQKRSLLVFPNPASNTLTINTNLELREVELIDFTGKIYDYPKSTSIDLDKISNGIYILRITDTKNIRYQKKIIVHNK